jgi:hypothetical protein
LSWSQVGAGAWGAAGGLLVVLLLWLVGAFSAGRDRVADLTPRLVSIERQLQDIAARPAPAVVDPKTVEELASRLARIESAQSAPRAPVTDPVVLGRMGAAEQAMKSLADNVAAFSRRSDAADAALRDIQRRLDALAAGLNDLRATARAAAVGSDRAARLATAAATLRVAVERGAPFASELAVVKALTSDGGAIADLEPFADAGVPGTTALANELAALVRPALNAAGRPRRDGGFLERLQANAENLVRIRPIGETGDTDHATALARVEQRAAQANIAGALAELAKLEPAERAPFQPWIARAEARNRAVEASRRLASDAVAALKATP